MTYEKDNIVFQPIPTHFNFKNVTGKQYGRLTVIGFAGRDDLKTYWFCECECGEVIRVIASYLQSKHTQSCGCFRKEHPSRYVHGMRHTPEYRTFHKARNRCNNSNDKRYKDYGGRGIEFRFESFEHFFEHLGYRPSDNHSLDRIDVNGHYEIGNVRWATKTEQANNTRANKFWTYKGKTQTHIQWCREFGISHSCVINRIKAGWDEERAFTTPIRSITFQGQTLSRAEWSRKLGFGEHVLFNRFKLGWSVEKALTTPVRIQSNNTKRP